MRMYIRFLRLFLSRLFRYEFFDGVSSLSFRLMPWDCVVSKAGNDRYHAFMDMGRIDLLMKAGVYPGSPHPFIYTSHIRHCAALRMFQRFQLTTRLVHTDKFFFWTEHVFESGGKVIATAVSKNGLLKWGKIMPTADAYAYPLPEETLSLTANEILTIEKMEGVLKKIRGHKNINQDHDTDTAS